MASTIEGIEIESPIQNRGQVYQATHDGEGNRLPYLRRSFISFSYGGKDIEDFNLIAVTNGDRLNRPLYAGFVDNITDLDINDGQLFWSTHFKANTLDLTLATDGITEHQLDEFKQWFKPGVIRELILAERPNRGILARISQPPAYEILPFEGKNTVKIKDIEHVTYTTLYKGTISLSFVMDYPFWYSLTNLFDTRVNEQGNTEWIDIDGNLLKFTNVDDILKVMQEDHIPTKDMLLLDNVSSEDDETNFLFGYEKAIQVVYGEESPIIGRARIGQAILNYYFINLTNGLELGESHFGPNTSNELNGIGYFFYGGNSPCKPILTFALTPTIGDDYYITSPRNSYGTESTKKYNSIVIESTTKTEFKFTTPSIYTGYNQVIAILKNLGAGVSWEEVRVALRDQVKHFAPRAYAMSIIDNLPNLGTVTTEGTIEQVLQEMPKFLSDSDEDIHCTPAIFTFDSLTGQATAFISYRHSYGVENYIAEVAENVGDMVRSEYLIITDRNNFSDDGYIKPYNEQHPDYSYRIYTDVKNGLSNVSLQYRYQYL